MLRNSRIARLLWLLAIVLLLVRVGEAHLHLCLDGKQSSVAMHVEDVPTHQGSNASYDGHNDVDIDLSLAPWIKKVGVDEMPILIFAAILLSLFLPIVRSTIRPYQLLSPTFASIFALRPPLRGPPL